MTATEMKQNIETITRFSGTVSHLASDNNALFDFIEQLPQDVKEAVYEEYHEETGPINSIRRDVAQQLRTGPIDRQGTIDHFVAEKSRSKAYKDLFSLLYPFVDHQIRNLLYETLETLVEQLKADLAISENTKHFVVGFDGSRHTGSKLAWFAIYNHTYPNQQKAKQLFFSIEDGEISYSLYDRPKDKKIREVSGIAPDAFSYDNVLAFFAEVKEDILKDNFRASVLEKYNLDELLAELSTKARNAWIVKPGERARLLKEMLRDGVFKIGWGEVVKDVLAESNFAEDFLLERLDLHYSNGKRQINNKGTILSFMQEMKVGDVLFAASGVSDIVAIGVVTSDLLTDDEEEEYHGYREVDWLIDLRSAPYHPDFNLPIKTVTWIEWKYAIQWLKDIFQIKEKSQIITMAKHPLNTILYGPPGTGKTYNTIDTAVEIITGNKDGGHEANKVLFDSLRKEGRIEFLTFHQNFTYEDFMVGLTPDITAGQLRFDRKEGIFKKICDRARKNWEAASKHETKAPDFATVFNSFFNQLIREEVTEVPVAMKTEGYQFKVTAIEEAEGRIKFTKKSGGTGHDLLIRNVQGIYEGSLSYPKEGLGIYYYPLVEALKEHASTMDMVVGALEEELKRYVLVIDEINRANISRVFGELITLLEDDKRLGASNELTVTLPNGEEFGVPPNLYVVGTMNTADKSISLIDIALRRRFEFIGKYPDYHILARLRPDGTHLLKQLNENIYKKRKSADYLIGHAYLLKEEPIEHIISKKILPLLMEYFSGRVEEVTAVFEQTGYTLEYNQETFHWTVTSEGEMHAVA